jgi:hypothetical protein
VRNSCRRNTTAGQPFLQVSNEPIWPGREDTMGSYLPVAAINRGAELVEAVLNRQLFPLK